MNSWVSTPHTLFLTSGCTGRGLRLPSVRSSITAASVHCSAQLPRCPQHSPLDLKSAVFYIKPVEDKLSRFQCWDSIEGGGLRKLSSWPILPGHHVALCSDSASVNVALLCFLVYTYTEMSFALTEHCIISVSMTFA